MIIRGSWVSASASVLLQCLSRYLERCPLAARIASKTSTSSGNADEGEGEDVDSGLHHGQTGERYRS